MNDKTKDTQPDLSGLTAGARSGLEALQRAMSDMKLARHDEWGHILFGTPWVARCRPDGAKLTLEVWPERPHELREELFTHWQPVSGGLWVLPLNGPDAAQKALPLIQATYHQLQIGTLGRTARIERFVAALREAFTELGPDIEVKNTKTTEQYWRGDIEIGRVRINKDTAYLMLRHTFSTLNNPEGLGRTFHSYRKGWPEAHFESYFGDVADVERLKPLLRQTYEANRQHRKP